MGIDLEGVAALAHRADVQITDERAGGARRRGAVGATIAERRTPRKSTPKRWK